MKKKNMFFSRDTSSDKYALSLFFLGLAIIIGVLTLSGCKSTMPAIDVSVWAGDSAKDGISRSQENKTIPANDPNFDDYACVSYEDLQKIFNLLQECQQWPSSETLVSSKKVFKRFVKRNPEVIEHAHSSQKRLESNPL